MKNSVISVSIEEEGMEKAQEAFRRDIEELRQMLLVQQGKGPIATAIREELGLEEDPSVEGLTIARPPFGPIVWDAGEQFVSTSERSKEGQRRKTRLENMVRSALSRFGPFHGISSSSTFSWLALDHPQFRATVQLVTEKKEVYTVFVGPNLQARCFKGGAVP